MIARTIRTMLVTGLLVAVARAQGENAPLGGDVVDVVEKGGVVMVVILGLSIVGLALAFERLVALRRGVLVPATLKDDIEKAAAAGDRDRLETLAAEARGPLGRVLQAGLRWRRHGPAAVERAMEQAGEGEVARLKRPVRPLAILATIEPMLGLLGTVLGMISTFNTLHATTAAERVAKLAPGIGQALYTTAAGLCVAIPFVLLYHFLNGKVNRAAEEWSRVGNDLLFGLQEQPAGRPTDSPGSGASAAGSAEKTAEEAA